MVFSKQNCAIDQVKEAFNISEDSVVAGNYKIETYKDWRRSNFIKCSALKSKPLLPHEFLFSAKSRNSSIFFTFPPFYDVVVGEIIAKGMICDSACWHLGENNIEVFNTFFLYLLQAHKIFSVTFILEIIKLSRISKFYSVCLLFIGW